MTNEQLVNVLKATIDTGTAAGLASPQDAEAFVDLSRAQTSVMQEIRVETGIRTSFNLDSIALGEPVTVAATEGVAPGAADVIAPARTRRLLAPKEVIAAFDVSFSFLRKNIQGEAVNDTLNTLFAKRFGKDMVMLLMGGDVALAADTRTNKLLRICDGVVKRAAADAGVRAVVIGANPSYVSQVFPAMIAALPKDYRDDRAELRFFVSADVYDSYAQEIGSRPTTAGDAILVGSWEKGLMFNGVKLIPVFGQATNKIVLTPRDNLAMGFGKEMTVGRDIDNRERLLKVTLTADVDVNYAVSDALVLAST